MNINFYLLRQKLIDLDKQLTDMNSKVRDLKYKATLFWTPDKFWVIGDQDSVFKYTYWLYTLPEIQNTQIGSMEYYIPNNDKRYLKLIITPK